MKYQCDSCKKKTLNLAEYLESPWVELHSTQTQTTTKRCPYCNSLDVSEFVEPIEELEDVISVEYVNVGAKIAEGYKVKEIYAKSVTLVKPKKRVEGDYIQEAMEKARQP
jgi:DNA-directed RNA polymerase subunit RPC12/RpoP